MVYIADVSSTGVQHEQFNKSFLTLFKHTYPNEKIVFFSDESHGLLVKSALDHITSENIPVYDKRGTYKEFIRAYNQYKSLLTIIKRAEEHQVRQLIVLLVHPLAHFLLKHFSSTHVTITLVMHGELESLKFNKHFVNKVWGWFLANAMSKHCSNIRYIILGESIYTSLVKVLPDFKRQKTTVLDHPYPFDENLPNKRTPDRITLSSLGVASVAKSTQHFFQVSKKAMELGLSSLTFQICGRVYANMKPYLNSQVKYKENFGSLTREELNAMLAKSDFAVFYYNNEHYSLCSSGAFWDAVNAEIPLIYLHNDYFDYYAKITGNIGIAFDNLEELNEYILHLGKTGVDEHQYKQFVANIKMLKSTYMSTPALSAQLKSIFE